jgi:cyclohexyl-isocyanide hydratase
MIIGIPVYGDVDMLDVAGPHEMFSWAGFEVDLLAEQTGLLGFRNGFSFQVSRTFDQARDYDAIWVPGGDPAALARIMGDPKRTYLDFLIAQSTRANIVASVCEGALLLAAAGLLDGYVATTHWAFIPCLTERFPNVKIADGHPRFCHDRDRLTGGGISSGLDEALRLIEILTDSNTAARVQISTQYYPHPPITSVIPVATNCLVPPVQIPPRATVP